MSTLFVFITVALALKNVSAGTIKPAVEKTIMDDIFNEIGVVRKDIEDTIIGLMPDTQNITKFVIASSKEFADSLEKSTNAVKLQAKNLQGVVENSVKEFTTKLTHSASKLKQITDSTMEQAGKIVTTLEAQIRTIFDDVQAAVQSNILSGEGKLAKAAGTFFSDIITAGKRFQLNLSTINENKN